MAVDGFAVGHFGFFKDPDMTQKLDDENLYDQMDANGWIDVWLGGQDVFIPDYGLYNVYLTCEQTFFWDILDEAGNRTKTGFKAIHIPFNELMEPYTGDIIPLNPEVTFDNHKLEINTVEKPLICSNLWFYTNYFDDEYYRYNLLVLDRNDLSWPNEVGVEIRPMNDTLKLMPDEYIVGYRPKIEYMNQLAILKKLKSGKDNKIWFRMQVDLEFLSEFPDAKRSIRIFSQEKDNLEYLLYPRNPNDIIWRHHGRGFLNEYQRYLLQYGVQQYMPDDKLLDWGDRQYAEFMEASNYVMKTDESNFQAVASDIDQILAGDQGRQLIGYSALIVPKFLEWFQENTRLDIVREMDEILYRVILTQKYFKGFQRLDEYLGGLVGDYLETTGVATIWDGATEIADGNIQIVNGGEAFAAPEEDSPITSIVIVDGVRQYPDGYVPESAMEYRYPTKVGYEYSGDIGNGLYKIRIAEQIVDVFCDMTLDGGGWMYVVTSERTSLEYISQFGDITDIASTFYTEEAYGLGWGENSGFDKTLQTYNMPFSEVIAKISGEYDNPTYGTGYLDFFTSSSGNVVKFYDNSYDVNDGQTLIVDGVTLISNSQENLVKYSITSTGGTGDVNSLTIKMRGDQSFPYCRRFIYMVAVR